MSYSADSALMRAIDDYSINDAGIESAVLMERAALAVAKRVAEDSGRRSHIIIVYGRGNNGGDGLAAGRILKLWGYEVSAVPAAEDITPATMSEEERKQYDTAVKCGVMIGAYNELSGILSCENAVIVDAIFGIGLTRVLKGDYARTVDCINSAGKRGAGIYSVDIPSGISADNGAVMGTAVKAGTTVTFGYAKHGLLMYSGAFFAGKVYVEDAGFAVPSRKIEDFAKKQSGIALASYFADESEVRLPERFSWSNKGSYGKLLIIAGNRGCSGAGYLCTHAAFMAGTGMVKVLTCTETVTLLNSKQPEAMTGILFKDDGTIDRQVLEAGINWADSVLIGPGIGRGEDALEALKAVLASGKKTVADADALALIAESVETGAADRAEQIAALFTAPAILTPHIGELTRLTGKKSDELKAGIFDTAYQYTYNNILTYVCKDARTVVASGGKLHININGNSGMSTAGAGDVLAGLIAGFSAAGLEPFEAARTGVFIHAMAGDAAAASLCEDCITAGDIADRLAECISGLRKQSE